MIVFVCALAPTWGPLLSEQALDGARVAANEPGLTPLVVLEHWETALERAFTPQLRAYIELEALHPGQDLSSMARWWASARADHPRAAAAALARLDTEHAMWHVSQWPESLAEHLPRYRLVLTSRFFEAFESLDDAVTGLQQEIDAFDLPDLTPPEGLPFRAAPSNVRDPELREEYRQRLNRHAQHDSMKARLHEMRNVSAEYTHALSGQVRTLYQSASPEEISALADRICREGWKDLPLTPKVLEGWDTLARAVDNACKQP